MPFKQDIDLKQIASDSYDPTEETSEATFEIAPNEDIEGMGIKQQLLLKVINKRNQNLSENFIDFVADKYKKMERKQRYVDIKQSEIEHEFNTANLNYAYMRKKKFKDRLDIIQFSEFLDIHFNRKQYIEMRLYENEPTKISSNHFLDGEKLM